MSQKLYAAFVPLLAVIAFVGVPAVAQAQPTWEACKEIAKETGKWTTVKCNVEKAKSDFEWETVGDLSEAVLTDTKNVAGTVAKLENEAKTGGIECKKVEDESRVWNSAGRGRDINEVQSTECKGILALAECTIATPIVVEAYTRLELEGVKIYNKFSPVDSEPFTEITLSGAKCPLPGTFPVTGTARGEMTAHGNKQKFNAGEDTLDLLGENWEFTGEVEMELSPSKGGVRVNGGGAAPHACKTTNAKWVFCSGGDEIGNETPAQTVKAANGSPTVLQSTIKGLNAEVQCTKGTFEQTLVSKGDLIGVDMLENCSVTVPTGTCTINKSAITTEPLVGELEGPVPGGPPELKLSGAPNIAIITIEGCAALEGKYTVTGEQKCKLDAKYETEEAEHEILCEKAGSKLKLEGEAASLAMTAKGPLESGAKWSIQLN